MLSIRVINNIVSGFQNSPSLPKGNIEIDQTMRDTLKAIKDQAALGERDKTILWNDGTPTLITDNRLVVQFLVNGSSSDVQLSVGESFTVTVTAPNNPKFNGSRVFRWFDRLFKIKFSGGVGTKAISSSSSLEYAIGPTVEYSANTITVMIVE